MQDQYNQYPPGRHSSTKSAQLKASDVNTHTAYLSTSVPRHNQIPLIGDPSLHFRFSTSYTVYGICETYLDCHLRLFFHHRFVVHYEPTTALRTKHHDSHFVGKIHMHMHKRIAHRLLSQLGANTTETATVPATATVRATVTVKLLVNKRHSASSSSKDLTQREQARITIKQRNHNHKNT